MIARISSGAHGVVTRDELLEAGVTSDEVQHRIKIGALIPEYAGVYRAGHCGPSTEARYMAATKAGGDGALLCGLAGGYLLRILKSPSPPPPEILTPTERKPKGLKTRRTKRLDRRDATTYNRIPVTTVARTLVDLAAVLDDEALARACHEAGVRYGTTPRQVKAVLARRPNATGATKLTRIMSGDTKVLLSKLEKRFPERLAERNLPAPDEMNRVAGGRRVDCRWLNPKVTVELLGFHYHNSRHAWDRDQDREREAYARGDHFRRYTYKDVFEDPRRMFAELDGLLA